MTRPSLGFLVCCTLLSSFAAAQMSTLPAAQAIADLPGPPKNPPIFSEMTVILQGGLEFENTIDISGPVAEVQRVDQLQSQSETAERRVTTLKLYELQNFTITYPSFYVATFEPYLVRLQLLSQKKS